jgi:hypothetical protein
MNGTLNLEDDSFTDFEFEVVRENAFDGWLLINNILGCYSQPKQLKVINDLELNL